MSARLRGALVVTVLAAAAAAVAVAVPLVDGDETAGPTGTTTGLPPDAPRALVIGDSNLFESGAEVDAALADEGFAPDLVGRVGFGLKDLDYWLDELPRRLEPAPAVVVVGLGTNDTLRTSDVSAFPSRLDRLMHAIGGHPVVWITHVADRPGAPDDAGRTINEMIRAAPTRWPNLAVLDFGADLAADPGLLREDALHFSSRGMREYAAAIADATVAAATASRAIP